MKIISYNINGIRAGIKKGFLHWLKGINPDIVCLQEIKLTETELVSPFFEDLGYYCYWFPAKKRGYSGVAIISKQKASHIEYGIDHSLFDEEGRVIRADFENFSIFSTYFPSGSSGDDRQAIKMKFIETFFVYINNYRKLNPDFIICGDVNICHNEIDIHNPKANIKTSGFLLEERQWVGKFIDSGISDGFRFFNKNPHQYTWWSYRAGAKSKNLGWRIDYTFVSKPLESHLKSATIHSEVEFSDHCPIELCLF